jgi:hypothetical protein
MPDGTARTVYKEHIFPHPDRASGTVYFELLVGIWLEGETQIFISNETVVDDQLKRALMRISSWHWKDSAAGHSP